MKSYQNIEKSGFPSRQYVGYSADGRSWRIAGKSGYWSAIANLTRQGSCNLLYGYRLLSDISSLLEVTK